jgi:hypothetical protein
VSLYGRSQFTSTTSGVSDVNNTVLGILGGLLSTPANLGGQKGITANDINTGINSGGITNLINQPAGSGTNPKAGLCCLSRRQYKNINMAAGDIV